MCTQQMVAKCLDIVDSSNFFVRLGTIACGTDLGNLEIFAEAGEHIRKWRGSRVIASDVYLETVNICAKHVSRIKYSPDGKCVATHSLGSLS